MQVIVNKLLVSYDLRGKGSLVLLFHGWGDNKETFNKVQDILSSKFQVLALDLPGFGQSQAPPAAWDLDNYSHFVKIFLEKLGLPMPYAIIGHSNGGALAIRATSTQELTPHKLILLASSGIRRGGSIKKTAIKILAKVGKVMTFWLPERRRRQLQKALYGVVGSDMLVAPHLRETFKKTVKQDIQTDAIGLDLPVLLIYASGDRAVPISDGRKLSSLIKNSKLVEIPGADHFLHHSAETTVIRALEEFL